MEDQEPLLDRASTLLSETMGDEAGELFHKFYELEDDEDVMTGVRSLLTDFIGPKMTEIKLKEISGRR
jgi:hypothetical protein